MRPGLRATTRFDAALSSNSALLRVVRLVLDVLGQHALRLPETRVLCAQGVTQKVFEQELKIDSSALTSLVNTLISRRLLEVHERGDGEILFKGQDEVQAAKYSPLRNPVYNTLTLLLNMAEGTIGL